MIIKIHQQLSSKYVFATKYTMILRIFFFFFLLYLLCRRVQKNSASARCSLCQWIGQVLQQQYSEQFGGAQIQIVGSCGLHIIHNSIKTGFGVWQIEKLLKALHFLFHCAPARQHYYSLVTKSTKFPLPFCGHRWLENLPAVENLAIHCHLCGPGKNEKAPQPRIILIWHCSRGKNGSPNCTKVACLSP